MTRSLILGVAASTLIFLSAYGGMVSLAQLLLYGVAGFVIGNWVAEEGSTKGLTLGLNPWVAVAAALVITTIVALVLGALSSRTFGIYFLMLTLTYAVIGYYVFGQVANISGFGGITGIDPPPLLDGPVRLYYVGLALSVLAYLGFRAIRRTPFGVALEGVRDDPIRMASLGLSCSAPSHVGVRAGWLRRRHGRRAERVVERADRPEHRFHRRDHRSARDRCHRWHRQTRGRVAGGLGVRRRQQLHA